MDSAKSLSLSLSLSQLEGCSADLPGERLSNRNAETRGVAGTRKHMAEGGRRWSEDNWLGKCGRQQRAEALTDDDLYWCTVL